MDSGGGCVRLGVVAILSTFIACGGSNGPSGPSPVPQIRGGETLFTDDFESGTLDAWQDGVNPTKQRVVTGQDAQSGDHYLAVTYPPGADGGWLTRFFMPGYEAMYVSFYVRFPSDWSGGTKLVGMYGNRVDNQWSGFGKSGECPNGTDFFDTMLVAEQVGNPGPLRFYTYYPDMAREPDGVVCYGRFGTQVGQATYQGSVVLRPNAWHKVEFYVQLNTPGVSDGLQTFWVDGTQAATWQRMRLRDTDILRLNAVQMSFSAGDVPKAQELNIDSIEVRTQR
ncbi:MAG TPA: hypothetical protein VGF24_13130 [Vicinamibacterales bacterium]|jgi:hypothetical protein